MKVGCLVQNSQVCVHWMRTSSYMIVCIFSVCLRARARVVYVEGGGGTLVCVCVFVCGGRSGGEREGGCVREGK